MTYSDKLKELISNKINIIKKENEKALDIDNLILSIDESINDNSKIVNLDFDKLYNYVDISLDEKKLVSYYVKIKRDGIWELGQSDYDRLNVILLNIKDNLSSYKDWLIRNNNSLLEFCENLLLKVDNFSFDSDDIDFIVELVSNGDIDLYEFMKNLSFEAISRGNIIVNVDSNDELENVSSVVSKLNSKDLIELFNKYNINYNMFDDECKNKIQDNGNLSNIEKILEVFNNKKINITPYIEDFGKQLASIFVFSNERCVNNVFNVVSDKININEYFGSLLKIPSIFVPRKRREIKNDDGGDFGKLDGEVGHNEDFVKNFTLLSGLGVNIKDALKKCSFIFDLSNYHINMAINQIKLYEPQSDKLVILPRILKKLTSLQGIPGDGLDVFIEQGCLDYVLSHPSRLYLGNSLHIAYKLYYARSKGVPISEMFNSKGFKYSLCNYEDMNSTNGSEIIKQYKPLNENFKLYDEAIVRSENDDISLVNGAYSYVIKALDNCFFDPSADIYTYKINGIIISRIKVLRFLNTLIDKEFDINEDLLLYVITKNSILNEEEYNKIRDTLSSVGIMKKIDEEKKLFISSSNSDRRR